MTQTTMLQVLLKHSVLVSALAAITTSPILAKGTDPKSEPECKTYVLSPLVTGGLENIIVETYYVSDNNDSTDVDGGHLATGSTTYRIYVDMAPGYKLQVIYGESNHPMYITTSTGFFNNEAWGSSLGSYVNKNKISKNTTAVDSWLTIGAASTGHMGVLKTEDSGNLIAGTSNDGGSLPVAGGLLVNTAAGTPLTTADGLVIQTPVPQINVVNLDVTPLESGNTGSSISTDNGSVFCINGVQGPTSENKVLIAQITTTGNLTFELNLQLRAADGTVEQYVAKNPEGQEIEFPGLTRH